MVSKWIGLLLLLAAIVIGDQIRINRPGHKYRLTIAVETPEGLKSASGVIAVHPDRSYSRGGRTAAKGDALFVDLGGGKNIVALLAQLDDGKIDTDAANYVALRAYGAAGRKTTFNDMNKMTGAVPVRGPLIPILVTFADPADPATARTVTPDNVEALGKGYRLSGISAEGVPNGIWPLDFGGLLGEPVTRGIEAKLPWLKGADTAAASALSAAGLPSPEGTGPSELFTRK